MLGQASRWVRRGRVAVLSVTVLCSSVVMAGWSMWSPSEAGKGERAGLPVGPVASASAPAASAEDQKAFEHQCLKPLRDRLFRQALRACSAFTAHPQLAASAHTALAAVYTDAGHRDTPASVDHALRGMALGDDRATLIVAVHAMAGWLPPHRADARDLLARIEAKGLPAARVYQRVLGDSERCRQHARALPLGHPLFCMFRNEVHEALKAQGMGLRHQNEDSWSDDFSAGDVLADARSVHVQYDFSPRESMHRLARLTLVFDDDEGQPRRRPELVASLTRKYGPPHRGAGSARPQWQLPDGVSIRLDMPESGRGVALVYDHDERWKARESHLMAQQVQIARDRERADADML